MHIDSTNPLGAFQIDCEVGIAIIGGAPVGGVVGVNGVRWHAPAAAAAR